MKSILKTALFKILILLIILGTVTLGIQTYLVGTTVATSAYTMEGLRFDDYIFEATINIGEEGLAYAGCDMHR